MDKITLHDSKVSAKIFVEKEAEKGVKRVAGKVMADLCAITGESVKVKEFSGNLPKADVAVIPCTIGSSPLLDKLVEDGKVKISDINGKWEVYKYVILHTDNIKNLLLVVGSDKLATIYGLFNISELCGVSPLVYWADSVIPHKNTLKIEIDSKPTKEPSVKFRGFFINDEWPCYGNWTMEHFKGFTAEMYDHVFELLLRLKGNYLWPAMWSSSFAWDGPGLKSYELADEYGIYIGNSHHEPCLRAGEEYRQVRGPKSIYGDAWNYHANTKGITRFWKDSLDERGMFTSMVTVGMRGEADSTILGANATLKDNIDLLKDVIVCQKKLIKETEKKYKKTFPQVLALYKEVEPFYYGDKDTEGLCDWDVLDDVILMLCEDNHGYLRTIPDDKMRKHPAGFGMYYHVDYHGDPISYEWINSSPLALMWEQMTQAYEYGVRSVWILNVGDLKHNEFPLTYFLNLAYDFDKYGTKAPNTCFDYTKKALATHFGNTLTDAKVTEAAEILTETVRINGYRRPEALNPLIYDSCHFHEAQNLLLRLSELEERLKAFEKGLKGDAKRAWYSLTGFQTRATIALIRMHLFGGLNLLQAHQNLKIANETADIIKFQIARDKELKKEWADFENHKWRGMELASHVGFTKWNEDGSRYPLMIQVEPFDRPRLFVSRTDDEKIYDKVYGPCMRIKANDFEFDGSNTVSVRLSNNGVGELNVHMDMPKCKWLTCDAETPDIKVEYDEVVNFTCDRSKLKADRETALVTFFDGDTKVEVEFTACNSTKEAPKGAFLPGRFGYSILARDYSEKSAPAGSKWIELKDYGVYDSGMKCFPVLTKYKKGEEPSLTYKIYATEDGEYTLQTDFTPTNPLSREGKLRYGVKVNGKSAGEFNTVPDGYRAGVAADKVWAEGVLSHRRTCTSQVKLKKGVNEVTLLIKDPGLVPLKLYLYKETPPTAYFGMPESVRK